MFLFLFWGGFLIYKNIEKNQNNNNTEQNYNNTQNTQSSHLLFETLSQQIATTTSDNITNQLQILYPVGGEVFCKEKPTTIQWKAPSDMETVEISLIVMNRSSNLVGNYPAKSEETSSLGRTIIPWDFKNAYGYTVEDGDVYQIMISGESGGKFFTVYSPHIFTIETCAGQ